jgi:hypothetical protein
LLPFVRLVFAGVGRFVRRNIVSRGGFVRRVWAPAMWKLTREYDIRDVGTNTNPTRERGAETLAFESVVHFRLRRLRVGFVRARAERG